MANPRVTKFRNAGHRRSSAGNKPVPGKHTGDIVSPHVRSQIMSRIRGKDTGPELAMAAALLRKRIRMERYARDLPGCPDFANRRCKLAVFVDGNFWHGWRFPLWKHKLSPKWQLKIEGNRRETGATSLSSAAAADASFGFGNTRSKETQIPVWREFERRSQNTGQRRSNDHRSAISDLITAFMTGGRTALPKSLILSRRFDGGHL